MINLETEYRRFQDFGLIVGMVVVITMLGSAIRYAIGSSESLMIPVRILFYVVLAWNLAGLRMCMNDEPPVPGFHKRSVKELAIGSFILVVVTALGGVCFELI